MKQRFSAGQNVSTSRNAHPLTCVRTLWMPPKYNMNIVGVFYVYSPSQSPESY